MSYPHLSQKIQDYASRNNVSISELERRAGLKPCTIRNIIHGRSKNPTIDTIAQIANELNCSVEKLLSKEDLTEKELLPENVTILKKCTEIVFENLISRKATPKMSEIFKYVEDVYNYTAKKNAKTPDKEFVEWLGEKILSK